jgi:hypothetical protein
MSSGIFLATGVLAKHSDLNNCDGNTIDENVAKVHQGIVKCMKEIVVNGGRKIKTATATNVTSPNIISLLCWARCVAEHISVA